MAMERSIRDQKVSFDGALDRGSRPHVPYSQEGPTKAPNHASFAPSHATDDLSTQIRQTMPGPSHHAARGGSHGPVRPPPPYSLENTDDTRGYTPGAGVDPPHVPTPDPMHLPCVIPQVSKSFRGAFFSPFARAYAPQLENHGIVREDFVAFIDGLNEAFIAHPIFQGLSALGSVMSLFYGVHPVQWAGMGLQTASGFASAATSMLRTKAYVKATNADLFHPANLHVSVLTTKKMMAKIGHPGQKLELPPLQDDAAALATTVDASGSVRLDARGDPAHDDDPRARRVRALHGYVMPLDFDVPDEVMPDNLLRKMGASQASRAARKQERKMSKKREKLQEDYLDKLRDVEKKQREGDKDIAKIENKLSRERAKLDRALANSSGKDQDKALRDYQKEERKLQEELEKEIRKRDKDVAKEMKDVNKERSKIDKKETKVANKIRWLVVAKLEGDEAEDDVDSDSAD